MVVYQRRRDRRPIVIIDQDLLGEGSFDGLVYAKWGHVTLVSQGDFDARFVAGSLRIINALRTRILPSALLPPARDVYLVQ